MKAKILFSYNLIFGILIFLSSCIKFSPTDNSPNNSSKSKIPKASPNSSRKLNSVFGFRESLGVFDTRKKYFVEFSSSSKLDISKISLELRSPSTNNILVSLTATEALDLGRINFTPLKDDKGVNIVITQKDQQLKSHYLKLSRGKASFHLEE